MDKIKTGTVFDTPYECGCVVLTEPDDTGAFTGLDSDGVECSYHLAMVERITRA